jgi:hypothetical protein
MAERLVKLTRVDSNPNGVPALVNLDNVAWMESNDDGSTHVLFAVMLTHTEHEGAALSIDIRESLQEIAVLAGIERSTSEEAIAQAWADQTARRDPMDPED